ncbi:hypothetical protein LPUS_04116 [Lasallia pustulata]|uniref:Apple domain-containing protein n=1 Tax=Lasallia pustulata TaxID=136370 RepID=A0A1W5CW36_9LECA|nr:hypothetical protein LPUS_04116 [Lasallia pustulata]
MESYQCPDHEGLQVADLSVLHPVRRSANQGAFYHPQPSISSRISPEDLQQLPKVSQGKSQRKTTIGGLRQPTFWLALALAMVIIVAVVGGGLGGSLTVKSASHSSCPFPTTANQSADTGQSTPTSQAAPTNPSALTNATQALTNLSVPAPSTVVSVALDCPAIDGKSYTSGTGSNFKQRCNQDLNGGSPALGNNGLINGTISDIIGIVAYSFTDCIEACSTMNRFGYGPQCHGVSFDLRMEQRYEEQQCNCWLKNATGEGTENDTVAMATLVVT